MDKPNLARKLQKFFDLLRFITRFQFKWKVCAFFMICTSSCPFSGTILDALEMMILCPTRRRGRKGMAIWTKHTNQEVFNFFLRKFYSLLVRLHINYLRWVWETKLMLFNLNFSFKFLLETPTRLLKSEMKWQPIYWLICPNPRFWDNSSYDLSDTRVRNPILQFSSFFQLKQIVPGLGFKPLTF